MAETGPKSADDKSPGQEEDLEPIVEFPAELSIEELDDFIAKEDPEFSKSVSEIGADKNLTLKDIQLSTEDQELADEVESWQKSKGLAKLIYTVFRPIPRVSLGVKKIKGKFLALLRAEVVRIKNFGYFLATDGKDHLVGALKAGVLNLKGGVDAQVQFYQKLSNLRKFFALLLVASVIATGFFIYRSLTRGVIPPGEELFITSMEALASHTYEYEPETEVELFYDNLRASQNLLLIPKLVANLKPTAASKVTPMIAAEFFIEGGAAEVIVEVKDREAAIKDVMQRTMEEFTFETLDSPEGKRELCETLKKNINSLLATGTINKVLIKTLVLRPQN